MNKVSSNHTGSTHETRLQAQSPIKDLTVVYFILALLTGSSQHYSFCHFSPLSKHWWAFIARTSKSTPKAPITWEWLRMQLFQMGERWWGDTTTQLACYKRPSFRYKETSDLFQLHISARFWIFQGNIGNKYSNTLLTALITDSTPINPVFFFSAVQTHGNPCITLEHVQSFSSVCAKPWVKKLVPSLLQTILTFLWILAICRNPLRNACYKLQRHTLLTIRSVHLISHEDTSGGNFILKIGFLPFSKT